MEVSWEEERAAFIAGEIGGAVIDLIVSAEAINCENIVGRLEYKRKVTGNTIHKGILRDAADYVRKGR